MVTQRYRKLETVIAFCVLLTAGNSVVGAEPIDFGRDVGPILQRRCLACHNDRDRRGALTLQSAKAAALGGENGPAIAVGDPESSYLLDLLIPTDGTAEMPKGEAPLAAEEIATIRRWISEGAVWPEDVVLKPPVLWSLKPLVQPEIPADIAGTDSFPIRNSIDAFVAARHREAGLEPAPQANRRTLIRRLYLDLTGLPPSPAAVEAFVRAADDEVAAVARRRDGESDDGLHGLPTVATGTYKRLVDELLESPHFGERWGRYWLDLARYADSEGYLGDALRPHAWVYREWVIDAFNRDLPFDQFTIEQLAGDLLEKPTLEQKIATGFHRNTLRNTEAGVDLELYRTKEVIDRVNTTGMVWLGLTLGCAECHDHKHDPISQTEFYRMYSFFNNADEVGVPATKPWEIAEHKAAMQEWQPAWDEFVAKLRPYENDELNDEQKAAISKSLAENGKSFDWKMVVEFYTTKEAGWDALKTNVDAHLKKRPAAPSTKARAFAKRTKDRRDTHVHIRGVYTRHGDKVSPGTPDILPELAGRGAETDRLDLARWLFHEENPLTARVAVNRIWQHLFGQGLVSTPNDFGNAGAQPTHPLLLDWLATEYRRLGWSRKAMIRLIVNSSTYRLSSAANAVPAQEQVSNQLLWRQNSYRASAEIVRDLHLATSGLLDRTIGRRGIRPPLPAFVTVVGRSVKWPVSQGSELYRRGMYIFFKRTVPYPMLMTFDAPDATVSCSRRERSNTPLQALTLLNDPVFYECAETLGRQMAELHHDDISADIDDLFLQCLGRRPVDQERNYLVAAYRDLVRLKEGEGKQGAADDEDPKVAAMIAVTRIVMNLDEFITRD
ncbi:MAG: PSD1 and planctomycete cytochrome C domain-containing protein [Planctomycetales bacterium]